MNPVTIVLRNDKYSYVDSILSTVKLTMIITNDPTQILNLYNEHFNILLTIGTSFQEYPILTGKLFSKWVHMEPKQVTKEYIESRLLTIYVANLPKRIEFRPKISVFTTSYKSEHKILRPYHSLLAQSMPDWEWVIVDDTGDLEDDIGKSNWHNLKKLQDPRIRLYKRNGNSGSIGNVKNEASSLCRGKYVFELDHDDEITQDCLKDVVQGFESDDSIGFIYMDFAELYEDFTPYSYGEGWGYGHFGSYYRQYVKSLAPPEAFGEKFKLTSFVSAQLSGNADSCIVKDISGWQNVAISCPINNLTIRDITSVPNHPRVWKKSILDQIGGYSESLPVVDDYELLIKTFFATKMARIPKLGYLQYKNADNNNFSLIRKEEIGKLVRAISSFYSKEFDSYFWDKPTEIDSNLPLYKRVYYESSKINLVKNLDYDKTILVLSIQGLDKIQKSPRTDVILVVNKEITNPPKDIKYHVLPNATQQEIENYFHWCYKTTNDYEIIK